MAVSDYVKGYGMPKNEPKSSGADAIAALRLVLADEHYRAMPAEELFDRYLADRDEAAFRALVRRYGPLVMRRCRDILRIEDLAQDAFQETFQKLVVAGYSIRKRGSLGPWLAVTARRTAVNIRRRERRQRSRGEPRRECCSAGDGHGAGPAVPDRGG